MRHLLAGLALVAAFGLPLSFLSFAPTLQDPLRTALQDTTSPLQDAERSAAEAEAAELQELRDATNPPFQTFCSVCHGVAGRGDGPLAPLLDPKPIDFTLGRPVISDRVGALPTDARLLRILQEGMPGSAMPAFHSYGEPMMRLAAESVQRLAVTRRMQDLRDAAKAAGVPADDIELRRRAERELMHGETLETPSFAGFTPDLERGAQFYRLSCLPCHGQNGAGFDGLFVDAKGHSTESRDLRRGLYRGGTSPEEIFHRIRVGIPYSGMPPISDAVMSDEDAMHVVGYVQSLLREKFGPKGEIPWAGQQRGEAIFVARVDELPTEPGDSQWDQAEVQHPSITHFDRRARLAGTGLEVRALHDRRRIAIRLRFENVPGPARTGGFGDGVALQLSTQASPSFFLEARFPGRRFDGLGPAWFWSSRLGAFRAHPEYAPGRLLALYGQRLTTDGTEPGVAAREIGGRYEVVFVRALEPTVLAAGEGEGLAEGQAREGAVTRGEAPPGSEVPITALQTVRMQVLCFDEQARPGLRGLAFTHWGRLLLDP